MSKSSEDNETRWDEVKKNFFLESVATEVVSGQRRDNEHTGQDGAARHEEKRKRTFITNQFS